MNAFRRNSEEWATMSCWPSSNLMSTAHLFWFNTLIALMLIGWWVNQRLRLCCLPSSSSYSMLNVIRTNMGSFKFFLFLVIIFYFEFGHEMLGTTTKRVDPNLLWIFQIRNWCLFLCSLHGSIDFAWQSACPEEFSMDLFEISSCSARLAFNPSVIRKYYYKYTYM